LNRLRPLRPGLVEELLEQRAERDPPAIGKRDCGERGASSTGPCPPSLDPRGRACDNERMDSSVIKAVGFVHLHVHSAYSLREVALTVES
jgi:hypothetical protein